ncbi:MAG: hypothetical protein P8Z71_13110 [Candidatus Sulfobium sp.]
MAGDDLQVSENRSLQPDRLLKSLMTAFKTTIPARAEAGTT